MRTDLSNSGFRTAAVCCVAVAILNLPDRADAQYQRKATGQPKSEVVKAPPEQRGSLQDSCTEVKAQAVQRDGGTRPGATRSDPFIFRVVGGAPPPTGSSGDSGKTDLKQNEAARAPGMAADPEAAPAAKGDPGQDKVAALAPGPERGPNGLRAPLGPNQLDPCE